MSKRRFSVAIAIAASIFGVTNNATYAIDWTGAGSDMNDAANWGGTLPTAATGVFHEAGSHSPVMNAAFNTRALYLDEDAVTPYTITGTGTLSITQTGLGGAGGYISSAADVDLTIDVAQLNMTRSNGIITGDYSTTPANSGTGNITLGSSVGGTMLFVWGGGSTSHNPQIIASNGSPNAGTTITIYPKIDFSTVTSSTSSNNFTLHPGATSTIKLLGGITGGATPSNGNPSKTVNVAGTAGGKVILGDSSGWLGNMHVKASDLEINNSNSLGDVGSSSASYTWIFGGANTGALRLTDSVSSGEFLFIDGRDTESLPSIRSISGNNTLSGNMSDDGVAGFSVISSDGTGGGDLLTLSGNISRDGAASGTLVLTGAGNGVVSGTVTQASSGVWDLKKSGAGTWSLSGSNSYTGPTVVSEGTLALTGSGSIGSTSSVDVRSGATFDASAVGGYSTNGFQVLKGAGTVIGNVTAGGGDSISPGDSGVGTLSISGGNLTLNGGTTLPFTLSSTPGGLSDKIAVTSGALSLSGTSTFNFTATGGVGNGSYQLITYTGALSGDASNLAFTGITAGPRQTYLLSTTTIANAVTLDVTGAAGNLTWVGGVNADAWDVGATINWTGEADNHFYDGDNVTFSNTATTFTPSIVGTVSPLNVAFTNTSNAYTTSGGGTIAVGGNMTVGGSGDVTLGHFGGTTVAGSVSTSGSGTFTLAGGINFSVAGAFTNGGSKNVNVNSNDFLVGGDLVQSGSGTMTIATTGTLGIAGGIQANGGTIALNLANDINIPSVISGAGALQKDGFNTVTLSGNNSGFTGAIAVNSGRLVAGAANALGTSAGGTTVASGATLDVNGKKLGAEIITIAGTGNTGEGALVDFGATGTAIANRTHIAGIVLTADATIASSAGSYPILDGSNGPASINANGHTLTVQGLGGVIGEWDFYDAGETHFGSVILKDGATYFGGTTTMGDQPGVITLQNNGALGLDGAPVVTKDIVVSNLDSARGAVIGYVTNATIASQITMDGNFEPTVVNGINNTNPVLTLGGKLTGAGSLTAHLFANGTSSRIGTVAITSNDNDYTGATVIGGGGGLQSGTAANDRIILSIGDGGSSGIIPAGNTITVNDRAVLAFNRNDTYTVSNDIITAGANNRSRLRGQGTGTVTVSGVVSGPGLIEVNAGTMILTNSNSFTGVVGIGAAGVIGSDAKLEISNSQALGDVGSAANGYTEPNGTTATSALVLTNNIDSGEYIYLGARTTGNDSPQIINKSGNNTLSGTIGSDFGDPGNYGTGGSATDTNYAIQSDAGILTLSGNVLMQGTGYFGDTVTANPANRTTSGAGTLTFKGASNGLVSGAITEFDSNYQWNIAKNGAGSWELSNANTYTGTTTVKAGTLNVSGSHTTGSAYTIEASGNLVTNNIRTVALTVDGTATVNADGGTNGASKVETLAMTGKLNLKNNDLVVGTGVLVDVRSQIKNGVSGVSNTAAVSGITSDLMTLGVHGFGYASGSDANLSPILGGSLSGQSYDSDSVLVKFTYRGDADLDGDSDLDDLGFWANSFTGDLGLGPVATPTTLWTQGDWDYDGDTDLDDLGFWSSTFTGDLGGGGLSVYAPNASEGAIAALAQMGITAVPEPGSVSLLALGIGGVLLQRLRRRRTIH